MNCRIRQAIVDDLDTLNIINKELMGYDYQLSTKRFNKLLESKSDCILVAVEENQVVGYIHGNIYQTLYMDRMVNILGFAVIHRLRHTGISDGLLNELEIWARDQKAKGLRLTSGMQRTHAHQFYRNHGFNHEYKQLNFKKYF